MNVGLALRNSPKGQIKYDRYWADDGRTQEVLDGVSLYSTNIKVRISPKVLSAILKNHEDTTEKKEVQEVISPSLPPLVKEPDDDVTDAYFYEQQSEMELPIMEYEEERLKYIHDTFNVKKCEFDNFSWELQLQIKQEYLLMRRKNELDAKRRAAKLQKIEEAILNEAREKEMLQQEQYQTHVKKLSAKVLDAELKQKKAEEALKKRQQEQIEFRVQLSNCQQEAQNLVSKSIEKLSSCDYPDHLRVPVTDRASQMTKTIQLIESFVEQAKTKDLTIDDILSANRHVKEAYETFHDVMNDIEQAKAKGLHAHERLAHFTFKDNSLIQRSVSNAETKKSETPIKEDTSINKSSEMKENESKLESMTKGVDEVDKSKERKKLLSLFIAPDAIDDHHKIMENLKQVEANLQPIKTDPRNKKCRFELQKAINVPINSLSSNSGSQIKSKINRLLSILCGKVPEFSKYEMKSDSAVYSFCTYLVAKQFVEQGDTQISAQHSTAFPIALAVLGVWSQKPDVGPLILGHFYARCPYLVPYYPPRREDQTDSDYFEFLGYHFDDAGNIEPQYKFLNRMSGYMRLYAAIMVSPLPPNVKTSHPHGLAHGWKWISRTLNLDPRVDITATLLYDFLEVTGDSLQKTYGKQFKKLLHILCKDYFHKIKQVTPGGSGPVERLETFLQQTIKKGYISPPDGILESHFWNR